MAYSGSFMDTLMTELLTAGSALIFAFYFRVVITVIHCRTFTPFGERYGRREFKDLLNRVALR